MGVILTSFDVETQIREQLKGRLSRFPPAQIHLADEDYWLTPLKDVVDLLRRERVDGLEYRGDVHDCDDFAHVLATRMIESQWQNRKRQYPHCFGEVWGVSPGGGHAINIMINDDGAVRLVEPQAEAGRAVMTVDECDLTDIWMIRI